MEEFLKAGMGFDLL